MRNKLSLLVCLGPETWQSSMSRPGLARSGTTAVPHTASLNIICYVSALVIAPADRTKRVCNCLMVNSPLAICHMRRGGSGTARSPLGSHAPGRGPARESVFDRLTPPFRNSPCAARGTGGVHVSLSAPFQLLFSHHMSIWFLADAPSFFLAGPWTMASSDFGFEVLRAWLITSGERDNKVSGQLTPKVVGKEIITARKTVRFYFQTKGLVTHH